MTGALQLPDPGPGKCGQVIRVSISRLSPVLKKCSSSESRQVIVIVGGEDASETPRSFTVEAEVLTRHSPFFANALRQYKSSGPQDTAAEYHYMWREGVEGVIRLPAESPRIFSLYLEMLETARFIVTPYFRLRVGDDCDQVKHEQRFATNPADEAIYEDQREALVELYILCDKLLDVKSQKSLLCAIIGRVKARDDEERRFFPDLNAMINDIYANTLPGDALRAFLVDCYVLRGRSAWSPEPDSDLCPEFLREVIAGIFETRTMPDYEVKLFNTAYYTCRIRWPILDTAYERKRLREEHCVSATKEYYTTDGEYCHTVV